jgi:hypothetical protein
MEKKRWMSSGSRPQALFGIILPAQINLSLPGYTGEDIFCLLLMPSARVIDLPRLPRTPPALFCE